MQIRNAHGATLQIAATGQYVEPGATVDVDDELGAALIEQPANWTEVPTEAPPAPTPKKKETDR